MPGARCARSRACRIENTRVSHHGHTGITRHSPRNGFNGFLRALPGDRLVDTVAGGVASADLTPAPGCQDHTTSPSESAPLVCSASASTASRPAAVTIACRPSVGRDGGSCRSDLPDGGSGLFLRTVLDKRKPEGELICPSGSRLSHSTPSCRSPLPENVRSFAGTNGLHTAHLVFDCEVIQTEAFCGLSMSASDPLADSNHTPRQVRKVPEANICIGMLQRSEGASQRRKQAVAREYNHEPESQDG